MADIVRKVELEIGLAKGGDKALKAIGKTLLDQLKKIEKEINDKQSEIENRIGQGLSVKRATGQLEKLRDEFEKVRSTVKEIDWSQEEYVRIEKDKIRLAKERLKLEKEFTKEVRKRARIERAAEYVSEKNRLDKVFGKGSFGYMAEKYGTQTNLSPSYLQDALLEKYKGAKSKLPKDYFAQALLQGQSFDLPEGYLQDALLEKYKGAKSTIPADYFAESGSKVSLQRKLEELNKLRDLKSPTSAGFKSLSTEIEATEKSLGRLTNRISGDGMASFRKFSHMIFNITGLFFIASRGFEGMIKTLTRGAEFDTMRQAFQGTTQDIENMRKASRGLLSDEKIFAFSNKATDLGIKIKDQPIFIDMAIRSMKAYGGGVEKLDEILEKVIKSTETAQKELSSLGIEKVDFQKKVQELSKALVQNNEKYELVNKSLETSKKLRKDYLLELDAEDQKMVKVQALLSLYGKTLKDVTDVEASRSDRILSISAHFENFTNTLSQKLLPVADIIFSMIISFMTTVTENSGRLATALGVISAALAGLSIAMIGTGNPIGVFAAALTAVLAAIAALETAYPSATSRILNANAEIASSIKDIEGAEKNLAELKLDTQEKITRAQGEEILTNETLLRQAKERLRIESGNKFQAFDEKATDMRTGALDRYQGLKSILAGVAEGFSSGNILAGMMKKQVEYMAENIDKAAKEMRGFNLEILNGIPHLTRFGQSTTVVSNLSALLLRNAGLTEGLIARFIQLGNAGKAAFFGINAGILSSEAGLKNLSKISSLFTKAIALSKSTNPVDLQAASALFSAISGAVDALQNAYNQPGPTEKIPGVEDRTKKEKGKDRTKKEKGHDLVTFQDRLKEAQNLYEITKQRRDALQDIADTVGKMSSQKIPFGTVLDFLNNLNKPLEATTTKAQTIQKLLDEINNGGYKDVQSNSSQKLTPDQQREGEARNLADIHEYIAKLLKEEDGIQKDILTKEIEQLDAAQQKISLQEAAQKVAQSMRDFTKDWNPGIKGLMTYFEMAEIAVRSLADTLTSELGTAWENVFGEANSLFEKFVKNVITKIAELLIVRGIAKLLTFLFPGVGEILGAGLMSSAGGGFGGGGDALGRGITNTYLSSRVDSRPINIYLTGTLEGQTFLKSTMPQYENYKQAIKVV